MATVEEIIVATKSFETADLFKLLKVLVNETEKKCKQTVKTTTTSKTVRKSTTNNGAQLKKPRAWVEFTLKHALENGWEAFTITQKKKDKGDEMRGSGGHVVSLEEIVMPCSIYHNECYVFEDSITEKTPNGRQLIHSHAMSLSKQRRENNHPSYAEFEAQYVNEVEEDTTDTLSKKIVVKKTAAEKEAEKEEAKATKEAVKAEAKAAKELVKATETKTEKAVKATEEVKKKSVTKVEDVPDDGMIHPWKFEG